MQEDITERERDASERLRVEQIKNEFISTVSHELRTPLTSIAGSLALLTGGTAGELSEKAARLIAIAHDNSQRLVRLVNDILDIEKIESGHLRLNFEPLDLRDIAQRSMDSVRGYADKLGVRLLLADGPPAPVRGDPDRLIQVITNLLSNACKFSPAGAGITVAVNREGRLTRLSVRDRGPGIPEEFRTRVFSKFAQVEGPDTRAKGGTGLGLAIAREISDLHGGQLWFESKPGEGATFHLDLPLSPQVVEGYEPPRLLVCEDDNQKAAILRQILKRDGFSIDIASTLDDSLRMAATGDYAAGLIDLHLPGADSIGLVRALRAKPETRDLPIVFITAVVGVEGRLLVVVDWLDKPLDHVRLRAALAASLDSTSSNRPLVLHVGDDPNDLQVTASALSSTADVIPAQSLSAARAALAAHRPDLVILDLELADGSGPDLLAELSDKMGRTIPVIVYSAQEMEPDVVQRVDAVLTKSRTSLAGLAPTIRRLIGKK